MIPDQFLRLPLEAGKKGDTAFASVHPAKSELHRPIDPQSAAFQEKVLANSRKHRIYRADVKSELPLTVDPMPGRFGLASDGTK